MPTSELRANFLLNLTGNLDRQMRRYTDSTERFGTRSQRALRGTARAAMAANQQIARMGNRYSTIIGGVAAVATAKQSAQLDKTLTQIKQTAGATAEQRDQLRGLLFDMARTTGQNVEDLLEGFNNLIQSGQSWEEAIATIQAVNPAMAVTAARAGDLSAALTVAAEAFDFDLSQPGMAVKLLDQMTLAGRAGNAELEDLSAIFGRVGVNAKRANLSFEQTLAFIEQLSQIERNPERLATLVDSSLRLFTNQQYKKSAAKATGVSFYDASGAARDPIEVLNDIAVKYKKLTSDAKRDSFIQAAFGKADLDTQKGIGVLLGSDNLSQVAQLAQEINQATGVIGKDLEEAINNSVDQAARLKNYLREGADALSQPINRLLSGAIESTLKGADSIGIEGKHVLGFGAGLVGLSKGADKLLQTYSNLRGATRKTPMYVEEVGGAKKGITSSGGDAFGTKRWEDIAKKKQRAEKLKALGKGALGVTASGAAGYAVGTLIYNTVLDETKFADRLGHVIAQGLAFLGNDNARAALAAEAGNRDALKGEIAIKVEVDAEGRGRLVNVNAGGPLAEQNYVEIASQNGYTLGHQ